MLWYCPEGADGKVTSQNIHNIMMIFLGVVFLLGAVALFFACSQFPSKWQKPGMLLAVLWALFAVSFIMNRYVENDWLWRLWTLCNVVVVGLLAVNSFKAYMARD